MKEAWIKKGVINHPEIPDKIYAGLKLDKIRNKSPSRSRSASPQPASSFRGGSQAYVEEATIPLGSNDRATREMLNSLNVQSFNDLDHGYPIDLYNHKKATSKGLQKSSQSYSENVLPQKVKATSSSETAYKPYGAMQGGSRQRKASKKGHKASAIPAESMDSPSLNQISVSSHIDQP